MSNNAITINDIIKTTRDMAIKGNIIQAIKHVRDATERNGQMCSLSGAKRLVEMLRGDKVTYDPESSTEMLAMLLTDITGDDKIRQNHPCSPREHISDPELDAINDAFKAISRITKRIDRINAVKYLLVRFGGPAV